MTGAIALFVAGRGSGKFWDLRPFTRVVEGLRGALYMRDYVQINQLEAQGIGRRLAETLVKRHSTA